MQFSVGKIKLDYYSTNPSYNKAWKNERAVEVALGFDFIKKVEKNKLLEIGAVMPYYGKIDHEVLDAFDPFKNCIRCDALTYDYNGKNVLSISTLEHMGIKKYAKRKNKNKLDIQIDHARDSGFLCLKKIMKQANSYLVTIPIGFNRHIEKLIIENGLIKNAIVMKRLDKENNWKVDNNKDINIKYGKPFECGNGIIIFTNIEGYK